MSGFTNNQLLPELGMVARIRLQFKLSSSGFRTNVDLLVALLSLDLEVARSFLHLL